MWVRFLQDRQKQSQDSSVGRAAVLGINKYMLTCKHCSKTCKSIKSLINHERLCPKNENRNYVSKTLGHTPWNKGKTGLQDAWNKGLPGTFTGRKHTDETKRKISEKLSVNNKGGRSKWYEVAGQKVQGTWERNIALKLEELEIKWVKLKTNIDTLKYEMEGKIRSYTPDFYLPEFDMYLEIKGFWWGNDKEKMRIVLETHKDKRIVVVEKLQYEQILLL
jgi:hypothetical protein